MSLPMPLFHPITTPRKNRIKQRTALVALFSLLTFTCYLLFVEYPSLGISRSLRAHVQDHDRTHDARPAPSQRPHRIPEPLHQPAPPPRPPLALSSSEELAALAAFIAALPHNVLPSTVDPSAPLDPQLVLDFDPRSESAREELDRVVEHLWDRFPVMLFTKLHSSDSREVRNLVQNMHLNPAPLVVQVDQREDAHVLLPLLARLTQVPSLPVLLIGGQAIGTEAQDTKGIMQEIRRLHQSGELTRRMLQAGATVEFGKRKGKGK